MHKNVLISKFPSKIEGCSPEEFHSLGLYPAGGRLDGWVSRELVPRLTASLVKHVCHAIMNALNETGDEDRHGLSCVKRQTTD